MRWWGFWAIVLAVALGAHVQTTRAQEPDPVVAVVIRSDKNGVNSCLVYDSMWQPHEVPREQTLWVAASHFGRLVTSICVVNYTIDVAPGGYCLVQIDGVTYWLRYRLDPNAFGETVITCNGRAEFITTLHLSGRSSQVLKREPASQHHEVY